MRFEPKQFKGKKACVIGLGRSGLAAARLLSRKGFKVFASDVRPRKDVQKSLGRLSASLQWEAGGHSDRILKCDFAVKSPGLAPSAEVFQRLKQKGIPVFSEMEIALAFCKTQDVVAITGTNGKTTTTALVERLFKAQRGRTVHLCGNIGVPLSEIVDKIRPKDVVIMEISSYQLEDSRFFKPRAAALLNITADHLDHHGSMARYIEAKASVFSRQSSSDFCVFNAGDPLVFKLSRRCPSQKLYFGPPMTGVHAWTSQGKIHVRLPGSKKESLFTPPALPGAHNLENAMSAILLALKSGIKPALIAKGLKSFKGVEHRIEEAGKLGPMRCINDSKATNVDSTLVALKAFPEADHNIFLILGGLHKGSPYTPLKSLIQEKVKGILTIGSAAGKIEEDLGGSTHIFPCGNLKTAVETALKLGSKGDMLLLSPACASFDQFKNFEERGRMFKELVKKTKP